MFKGLQISARGITLKGFQIGAKRLQIRAGISSRGRNYKSEQEKLQTRAGITNRSKDYKSAQNNFNRPYKTPSRTLIFPPILVSFHNHSRIIEQHMKRECISLTPHYHLDISRAIIADSSPLNTGSSQTRTGDLCFLSASREPLSYATFKGR